MFVFLLENADFRFCPPPTFGFDSAISASRAVANRVTGFAQKQLSRNDAMAAAPHPGPLPANAGRGRDSSQGGRANHWVRTKSRGTGFPLPSRARGEGQGEGSRSRVATASFRLRISIVILPAMILFRIRGAGGGDLRRKTLGGCGSLVHSGGHYKRNYLTCKHKILPWAGAARGWVASARKRTTREDTGPVQPAVRSGKSKNEKARRRQHETVNCKTA